MSFDLTTKNAKFLFGTATGCLNAWQQILEKHKLGTLTVTDNGVVYTRNTQEVALKNIKSVAHTYQHVSDYSNGFYESTAFYTLVLQGSLETITIEVTCDAETGSQIWFAQVYQEPKRARSPAEESA